MEQMNVPEESKVTVDYKDSEWPRLVAVFRPLLYKEEETFICILGADKETGVVGVGATGLEAMKDWENNLSDRIRHHKDDDELALYIHDTMKASVNKVW